MTPNKIAVTGGLGSGKSAFCVILREMGYPVFSCDAINRELWEDEAYLRALAVCFPDCMTGGTIDKAKLSRKVFSDQGARDKLNALSHPRIMERLLAHMRQSKGTVFAEVPLLFEGGYEGMFDAVIALRRGEEDRIRAVRARDGLSRADALARMQSQFDPARLDEKHCVIVENTGDLEELRTRAHSTLSQLGIV